MYLFLGVLAFVCALAFDLCSLKGSRWLKRIAGLASVVTFIYATTMVSWRGPKFSFPTWVIVLGWFLLGLSLFLLLYSLFIEIPFAQTYHQPGTGDRLVTTGTYALSRHPGVLWFALFVISLFLVSRSKQWLIAGPVWVLTDGIYAWIQDRYIFPLMFPSYADYQRGTPMLWPTKASMRRCMQTIGRKERATSPPGN